MTEKKEKESDMHLKKFLLFGLIAAVLPAVAEEAADRKTATSLKYVEHELDTRQNKFGADTNKAMEYTNAAGDVQKRAVTSNLGASTSDTSLPMVGGVNTKLATKQDDIAPINDHTAVTYTGTTGKIGAKGIYQATESYVAQSNNLIDAKTFNAALKKGLDSEFLCSEYKPGTDLCWVWSIHNNASTNLFDKTDGEYIRAYVHATTGVITEGTEQYSFVVPCQPNTTYSLSGMIGGNSHWGSFTDKSIGTVATVKRTGNGTITTGANDKYLIGLAYTSNGTYDYRNTLNIEKSTPYTTLVPAGYTPVEWIQGDKTAYINTGVTLNNNSSAEAKFQFPNRETSSSGNFIMGSRVSIRERAFTLVGFSGGTLWASNYGTDTATFGAADTGVHIMKRDKDKVYLDEELNLTTPASDFTTPGTAYVFAVNQNGTPYLPSNIKLWYLKIWDNGTLVRNYIPAKDSSGTAGLYDTVHDQFVTNVANSGAFTAGPEISNIVYIPQNQ